MPALSCRLLATASVAALATWLSATPSAADAPDKWAPRADLIVRPSSSLSSGGVDLFAPVAQNNSGLIFIDAGLQANVSNNLAGDIGVGFRKMFDSSVILGAWGFFNETEGKSGDFFQGFTLGSELLTEDFDARVNFYLPVSSTHLVSLVNGTSVTSLSLTNHQLLEVHTAPIFRTDETSFEGVDGEVGARVPITLPGNDDLRVYAGAYQAWRTNFETDEGFTARFEYRAADVGGTALPGSQLVLGAGLRTSDAHDTEFTAEVRLRIPIGSDGDAPDLTPLERRMSEQITREQSFATGQRTFVSGAAVATSVAINPATGLPYNSIFFADGHNTVAGGTQTDPTTLVDATTRAGQNGIIVAEGNAGTINTPGVTLQNGQQLLGGGTSINVSLTDGTLTTFTLGVQPGTIHGTGAGPVITLGNGNTIQNVTITGGSSGIFGSGISGGGTLSNVNVSGTTGPGISLANVAGTLSITGGAINGTGGAGLGASNVQSLIVTGTTFGATTAIGGDGISVHDTAGLSSVAINGVTVANAGGAGIHVDGSAGGTTTVTGFANDVIAKAGAGGGVFDTVTFDSNTTTPGIQSVAGGSLAIGSAGTPANIAGAGLSLNNVLGNIGFTSLTIANNGGTGLFVRDAGGPGGSFAVATSGGSIVTTGGAAADIDPVALNVILSSIAASGGVNGILLNNVSGSFTVTGTTTVSGTTGDGIALRNSSAAITFGTTSVTNAAGNAIALSNNTGAVTFGTTTITHPGTNGIDFAGANGVVTFGNTTITQLGAGDGVDFTGATLNGNVTFATLNITGTGAAGSKGIDFTGQTTTKAVKTTDSGAISGVAVGVDLTNANITGSFQYGDGSNTDADGAASTITATTPIIIAGMNAANGTYNFADVNLVGNTNNLSTNKTVYYVDNVVDGVDDGTSAHPGTLAGAQASAADLIVLVDTQAGAAADTIDAASALQGAINTFTLIANEQLLSFLNGDTLNVGGGGAPPNLILFGVTPGLLTNPHPGTGAPTLTTTHAGSNTVTLASGDRLEGVVVANGGGAQSVSGTGISGLVVTGSNLAGVGLTNATGTATLTNTTLTGLTVTGGSIGVTGTNADITTSTNTPAISVSGGHTGTMTFDAASSITATNGTGLQFNNAKGSYTFNGAVVLNGGDAGIDILAGSTGTFVFANAAITSPTGIGFREDSSSATVTYTGTVTQNNAASAVSLTNNTGGTVTFAGLVTANTGTATAINLVGNTGAAVLFNNGLNIDTTTGIGFNATGGGTITVAATAGDESANSTGGQAVNLSGVTIGAGGVSFDSLSAGGGTNGVSLSTVGGGLFKVSGTTAVSASTGAGIVLNANSAAVQFLGATTVSGAGGAGIVVTNNTAAPTFGTTTVTNAAADGIDISGNTVAVTFGNTTVTHPGANGIDISGADAAITFGNVTITQLGAHTGVDYTGATLNGNVTMATLNITGTGAAGSKGIDFTGQTTSHNVTTTDSGAISGVAIGVDLTNADITGTFQYGDGTNTDADGAASAITATTPIVIAGMNGIDGTYNFLDVVLTGDVSNLSSTVTAYYVDNVTDGTDDGSRNHPGTLAGAELSGKDVIVLVDTQAGAAFDTIDANSALQLLAGGNSTLNLADNQQLVSFLNGDVINVGGGSPPNLLLFGITPGQITNPHPGSGAPLLTTTLAGANTVTLGNANRLEGVVIANGGNAQTLSGTNTAGVTVVGSQLGGVTLTTATGTARFTDTTLTSLVLAGGAVNVTAVNTDLTNSANIAAFTANGGHTGTVTFDAASSFSITNGTGLQFDNADGSYSFSGPITLNGGDAGIDIVNGSGGTFTFANTAITSPSGTALRVDSSSANVAYTGSITQNNAATAVSVTNNTAGTITIAGPVTASTGAITAIDHSVNSGGSLTFSGAVSATTTSGTAINLLTDTGASTAFTGGLTVNTTTGSGFLATGGGTVSVAATAGTESVTVSGAASQAVDLNGVTVGAGGLSFDSISSAATFGLNLVSTVLTGSVNVGGLTATGTTGINLQNITGAGTINLTGATNLTVTADAIDLKGTLGTVNIANTAGATLTINGGANAIVMNAVTSGTVNIASAAGGASIGQTTSPTTAAISLTGDTGGTLNYGGTIKQTGGNVLTVSGGDLATATLSGAVTSTTAGTAFSFANADGTYTVSGSVSHTGGPGVAIDAASAGTITFSNGSKSFSTGTNTAVSMAGTGSLNFTNGGLAVTTTSGIGFTATAGTVNVTGAGNTINTTTGQVLVWANMLVGGSGATFDTLAASGVVPNDVVSFTNVDGGAFNGGAVSTGGTTGGGDGIFITGGSAATFHFTSLTTTGTAGSGFHLAGGAGDGTITIDTVNISGSSFAAIDIVNNVNTVTIGGGTATGGTLANATALTIANGSGDINVAAALSRALGATDLVTISGRTAGTVTLSGNLSRTGAGTGINVNNNTGGSVVFSGATKTLSTGTAAAVVLNLNTGSTVSFTNGGLAITTSSGVSFTALSGGTLNVTGAGNTINASAASGLNLNGVTVGAGGVTFDSITSGAGVGLNVASTVLTGALNIGGLNATGTDGADFFNITGAGGVNLTGTNTIAVGITGLSFSGTLGTINIANVAGSTLTIDGGGDDGISFGGVASGTVNVASAAGSASIGATTSPGAAGVESVGNTGGTLNYGGTIKKTSSNVLAVSGGDLAAVNLSGAITATTAGPAFIFSDADGTYTISGSVADSGGAGVSIDAASAGTVTFSNGSKTFSSGAATAISMAGTGSLNLTGGGLAITTTSGTGFITTGGTLSVTGAGNTINTATGQILSLSAVAIGASNVTFDTLAASGTVAANAINLSGLTGNSFNGGNVTIAGTSGAGNAGIELNGNTATVNFGNASIGSPAASSAAIDFAGTDGVVTFGDVTITGLVANTTGVDYTGATLNGNVTFHTLNIAGTSVSGTKGIDFSGQTTTKNVITTESGNISGVGIGVDLTNANITGNFQYGDGSNTDADGAASNITATTPIVVTGLNISHGTYNFADVNLHGDTSGLTGGVTAYFVDAITDGIDDGSAAHPGTLAGAEAAAPTLIILVDTQAGAGPADTIDAAAASQGNSGGNNSLDLVAGEQLLSFLNGDTITFGGIVNLPNVITFGIISDPINNPNPGTGAPNLTTTAAVNVVNLANNNTVDGVVITRSAGAGDGVRGANILNPTIKNSHIAAEGSAIHITDTTGVVGPSVITITNDILTATTTDAVTITASNAASDLRLALSGSTLSAAGAFGLTVSGDAGAGTHQVTVTDLSNDTVNTSAGSSAGMSFFRTLFDSDLVTAGFQDVSGGSTVLGTTGARLTGRGLYLNDVTGSLNYADLDIANNGNTGLEVANSKANSFTLTVDGGGASNATIDTTGGTALSLDPVTVNASFATITSTGGAAGIILDTLDPSSSVTFRGAVNITGTTATAIQVIGASGGTVAFNGAVTINNSASAGGGVVIAAGTNSFTGGLGITTSSGTGFNLTGGTATVTGAGNTITASAGTALSTSGGTVGAAGMTFASLSGGGAFGMNIDNVTLTGALNVGGLTATGAAGAEFSGITGAGGINLTGTNTITVTGNGLAFGTTLGTININSAAGSLTINGGTNGISLSTVSSGTINIANAGGTASIGATTSPSTAGVSLAGDTGGTLNYGGTLKTTQGNVLTVSGGDAATANLSGAITSTTAGQGFSFTDADGVYNISGSVSHTGGTGIAIDGASSGAITFSNASKTFSTGPNLGINMAGTGTLSFTNGGLGVTTTLGDGFQATSGTVVVSGSGNTITASTGGGLNLSNVTVGAGGVTFDSIASGGVNAVLLNGDVLTGAVNIGGLTATGSNGVLISAMTGAGGVNLTGTNTITVSGNGLAFSGTLGTININSTAGSLTIDGGTAGIVLSGVISGTINIADAGGSASIGATTSPSLAAVDLANGTGGTLNYGGTINATQGNVLSVGNDATTATLSGAITSTTAGTAFDFVNANGSYTISGSISHTGGAGVVIDSASTGTITFSNASKTFSTGSNDAVNSAGTGSLSFTNGGLGITTTTGTGFSDTGPSTLVVSGAGNTINAAGGTGLDVENLTVAAGGVTFAGITSGGGNGIDLENDVLTGTVNIANLTATGAIGARFVDLTGAGGVNLTGTNSIAVSGSGLDFVGTLGVININSGSGSLAVDGGQTGIFFSNVASGTVNVANAGGSASIGATTSPTLAAVRLVSGTGGTLNYGGTINTTLGAVLSVSGGDLTTATLSGAITSTATNTAFSFTDADGTYTISGSVSHTGVAGIAIDAASNGTITFSNGAKTFSTGANTAVSMAGSGTLNLTGGGLGITTTSGTGFTATAGTLDVTGASNTVSTGTGQILSLVNTAIGASNVVFSALNSSGTIAATGIVLSGVTGNTFTANNVTVAGTSGATHDGIALTGNTTAVNFGTVSITAPAAVGIDIEGANGVINFGGTEISSLAANTTGVDFTGATLNADVTFTQLDISGASATGTKGIDFTGQTTSHNVTTTNPGSITGVGIGVDLTNANITGSFQYGDGSDTNPDAASTINATTPIVITGLNAGSGTYNFLDVNLIGDTSNLSVSAFWVEQGASGAGTRADPGSLTAAETATATNIILLNDPAGGTDTIATTGTNGDDTFTLDANQNLYAFKNGDSLTLSGGGAPVNVLLHGVSGGAVTNPFAGSGAPLLTNTNATATVTLASGNLIDGVNISNSGGGAAITGSAIAGLTFRNSSLSALSGNGVSLTNATGALLFQNLTIATSSGSGDGLHFVIGAQSPAITFDNVTTTSTGGTGDGVNIAASSTGAPTITFTNANSFAGADNGFSLTTTGTNSIVLDFGTQLTLKGGTGPALKLLGTAATTNTITVVGFNGITLAAGSNGESFTNLQFDSTPGGALDALNGNLTLGTTGSRLQGTALNLDNVVGTLNFGALNIANNNGTGLLVANSAANAFTINSTSGTVDTTNGTAISIDPLTLGMTLTSVKSTGGANGISLGSVTGSFTVAGVTSITGATSAGISVTGATAPTVAFSGAVTIDNSGSAGTGVNIAAGTESFTGGLAITTSTGTGFLATAGTVTVTGSGNTITATNGRVMSLNGGAGTVTIGAAGMTFDSMSSTLSSGVALNVQQVLLNGSLNIGGLTVNGVGGGVGPNFANLTGTGAVNLTGATSINVRGFTLSGTLATLNIANTAGSTLTIDGGTTAIQLTSVVSGTVNVAFNAGSAAIGGLSTTTTSAIQLNGNTGGTLNYGGTINVSAGKVLAVTGASDLTTMTLSGAITSTTSGTAFSFADADGSYTISGSVSHTGGAGVAVDAASGGTILFSNASKTFSTGAAAGVSTAGTGSLSFTNGGLGITTTTGTGFSATAGTIVVSGAGNSIGATGGAGLNLAGVTVAAGGVTFGGGVSSGAGIAVNVSTVVLTGGLSITGLTATGTTGGNFSGITGAGGVTIAGTDSIDVSGNGLAFAGTLGAITIANTSGALTIDGGTNGIAFSGVSSGTVTIGTSGGSASIGATTSPSAAGVSLATDTGGTLSYGGTIRTTTGNVLTVSGGDSTAATLGGAITSTTAGTAFSFANADGSYTISGSVSHSGGPGISIDGTSGGTISFTNGAKTFTTTSNTAISMAGTGTLNLTGGGLGITTTSGAGFVTTAGTVNVTGASNTVNTSTGQILNWANTAIGASNVTFATLASSGTVVGDGILLSNVDGNTFNGGNVTIAGTSGTGGSNALSDGIEISGGAGSAFNFTSATISATANDGIFLSAAAMGTVTFTTVTINNTGAAGLETLNTNNTINVNAGSIGATNDTTTQAVLLTNGSGAITVASTLTKTTAGNIVAVTGRTGGSETFSGNLSATGAVANGISVTSNTGGTATFSGGTKTLTTGAGTAVNLATNTGMTINFTGGGLVITTTTASGYSATGGGTVTVQGAGNTIATTTGTALNIVNTTIGASNVTFQSISTSTSSGNAGIVADNTGGSGGVIVTGTGAANSGGTIANRTGADILTGVDGSGNTVSGSTGTGIFLRSTANASFTDMNLHDFTNFAIYGNNVTNFTLANSTISGVNGTNNGSDREEGSIRFDNMLGTGSITGSNISGGFAQNLDLYNTSGTLTRLTVNGANTFGLIDAANGNDNIRLQVFNSATANLTVQSNTFSGTRADFVAAIANNNSVMDVVIRSNTFHNGQAIISGGGGLDVRSGSAGLVSAATGTFDISDNTISDGGANAFDTTGIFVAKGQDNGTLVGTIQGNTLVALTGSNSDAIFVRAAGTGTLTTLILNNTGTNWGEAGIHLQNNDGSSTMNASIFGNSMTAPGAAFPLAALYVDNGATVTDTSTMNVVVGSSTTQQNTFSAGGGAIADVGLENHSASTHFNLSKNGSGSATALAVIDDDNVGSPTVDTSGGAGTITLVNTLPALPPAVAP